MAQASSGFLREIYNTLSCNGKDEEPKNHRNVTTFLIPNGVKVAHPADIRHIGHAESELYVEQVLVPPSVLQPLLCVPGPNLGLRREVTSREMPHKKTHKCQCELG